MRTTAGNIAWNHSPQKNTTYRGWFVSSVVNNFGHGKKKLGGGRWEWKRTILVSFLLTEETHETNRKLFLMRQNVPSDPEQVRVSFSFLLFNFFFRLSCPICWRVGAFGKCLMAHSTQRCWAFCSPFSTSPLIACPWLIGCRVNDHLLLLDLVLKQLFSFPVTPFSH